MSMKNIGGPFYVMWTTRAHDHTMWWHTCQCRSLTSVVVIAADYQKHPEWDACAVTESADPEHRQPTADNTVWANDKGWAIIKGALRDRMAVGP